MKIAVIVAGTNSPSNSDYLADVFIKGMREVGAEVQKEDLNSRSIDQFSLQHYEKSYEHEKDFRDLQNLIQNSDAVVIASPIWNFGVPAHLKNFIDRMGSFAMDDARTRGQLAGQPYYLLFTGGAPGPAWQGLIRKTSSFVPEAIKYFGGSVIGAHFEGRCTQGPGKFGLVVDQRPKAIESVRGQGKEFAQVVHEYAATGKLPSKQAFLQKAYAIGQRLIKKIS